MCDISVLTAMAYTTDILSSSVTTDELKMFVKGEQMSSGYP